MLNNKPAAGGVRELLVIALPMMISQGFETVMMFVDRLFLSKVGLPYMNAAMGGGLAAFVSMSLFFGIIGYTNALVATHIGAEKKSSATLAVTQSLMLAVLAYPLLLLVIPFADILFTREGMSPIQLEAQITYFEIMMLGSIVGLVRHALSSFFSGIGKTRIVMIATFVAMIVNIVLNYAMIFGKWGFPAMGIKGAAIASILGGIASLIILLVAYLRKSNRDEYNILANMRFDFPIFKKLLRFGAPSGIELFLNLSAFTLFIFEFHSLGSDVASAATITFNWDMLSFIPAMGVGIGVMSLVGRYMGAGSPDLAHRATVSGVKIIAIYSGTLFLVFLLFPEQLVSVFCQDDSNTTALAIFMVRTITIYVFADALAHIFASALRGAGDTFWTMVISVGGHWMLFFASFYLIRYAKASPRTVWIAVICSLLGWSLMLFLRYKMGKWRSIKVLGPRECEDVGTAVSSDISHQ